MFCFMRTFPCFHDAGGMSPLRFKDMYAPPMGAERLLDAACFLALDFHLLLSSPRRFSSSKTSLVRTAAERTSWPLQATWMPLQRP